MKRCIVCILLVCAVVFVGLLPSVTFAEGNAGQSAAVETINLNQANAEQLQVLPGVGPALAERIVVYRDNNGPFKSVDQLTEVKGIGQRKLEKLKSYLVI